MLALAPIFAVAAGTSHGNAASERVLASWKLSLDFANLAHVDRLTAGGGTLVFTERSGPIGGAVTRASRYSVAFARIGCVTVSGATITIYPAVRWGVEYKNLLTGKTSPGSKLGMVFSSAIDAQSALRSLKSESPYVRQKLGACKSDVDLYGLKFGTVPPRSDPFSWTRNSTLGASVYTLWVNDGVLYTEENDTGIDRHAWKKLPLSRISCVYVSPESSGLAAGMGVVSALPNEVLSMSSTGSQRPGLLTEGSIAMSFDDDAGQQAALQYLESKDATLAAKVTSSCK